MPRRQLDLPRITSLRLLESRRVAPCPECGEPMRTATARGTCYRCRVRVMSAEERRRRRARDRNAGKEAPAVLPACETSCGHWSSIYGCSFEFPEAGGRVFAVCPCALPR